jgi:FdhD protein
MYQLVSWLEHTGRVTDMGLEVTREIWTLTGEISSVRTDALAVEEPLEIRINSQAITTTMRTPGHDLELTLGWLLGEGIISSLEDLVGLELDANEENVVQVRMRESLEPILEPRQYSSGSACGVCGKTSLEQIHARGLQRITNSAHVTARVLYSLPDVLREVQTTFKSTGGLHAAALFTLEGELLAMREDVGRHNAVDKLVGFSRLENLPLEQSVMLVSGRVGFEIAQKSVAARVPILAAVGAPSSLAVDLAREFNLSLIGFLRGERANVYSGFGRIARDSVQNPKTL